MEDMFVGWPQSFSCRCSGTFLRISMKNKEETCTMVKPNEEKKYSCVRACYLVEYSQSSSECIEVIIKSAGPSGSFEK